MYPTIQVAVAVIIDENNRILLTRRAKDVDHAGLWEFPGGKIEVGETPYQGLCRELKEELAIEVKAATPLTQVSYDYPNYTVMLDVWQVSDYQGTPIGAEGQPMQWIAVAELPKTPLPAANQAIVDVLLDSAITLI